MFKLKKKSEEKKNQRDCNIALMLQHIKALYAGAMGVKRRWKSG